MDIHLAGFVHWLGFGRNRSISRGLNANGARIRLVTPTR